MVSAASRRRSGEMPRAVRPPDGRPGSTACYIGRAAHLRSRVASYWSHRADRRQIAPMVAAIARTEAVVCASPRGRVARAQLLDAVLFGPCPGGLRVRRAVSGLHRILPLPYTGTRLDGAERAMARDRARSSSPAASRPRSRAWTGSPARSGSPSATAATWTSTAGRTASWCASAGGGARGRSATAPRPRRWIGSRPRRPAGAASPAVTPSWPRWSGRLVNHRRPAVRGGPSGVAVPSVARWWVPRCWPLRGRCGGRGAAGCGPCRRPR